MENGKDRIELVNGQSLYAKFFYLMWTDHVQEALSEATQFQQAIENREASFSAHGSNLRTESKAFSCDSQTLC